MAGNRTILVREGLPMAHLKSYIPNFPKHPWERQKSLKLMELCASKVRWFRFVSLKTQFFRHFFGENPFFDPLWPKHPPHDRHIRKVVHLSFLHVPQHKSFFEPAGRQNFANAWRQKWVPVLTLRHKAVTHPPILGFMKTYFFLAIFFIHTNSKQKNKVGKQDDLPNHLLKLFRKIDFFKRLLP